MTASGAASGYTAIPTASGATEAAALLYSTGNLAVSGFAAGFLAVAQGAVTGDALLLAAYWLAIKP